MVLKVRTAAGVLLFNQHKRWCMLHVCEEGFFDNEVRSNDLKVILNCHVFQKFYHNHISTSLMSQHAE